MNLKQANDELRKPGWKIVSSSGSGNTLYMKPNEEKNRYDCIQIIGLGIGDTTVKTFSDVISVDNIKLYEQGVKVL